MWSKSGKNELERWYKSGAKVGNEGERWSKSGEMVLKTKEKSGAKVEQMWQKRRRKVEQKLIKGGKNEEKRGN